VNRRELLRACATLVPLPLLPVRGTRAAPVAGAPQLDVRLQREGSQPGRRVEVLRSVGAIPPEIVGAFREPVAFAQAASGQYFVLDRTGHTVYGIDAALTAAWKLVGVGGETGRILQPNGFGLAPNGSFVVADSPGERERVQLFGSGGALLGGFTLPGRADAIVTIGGLTLNGAGSLHYDGRTLLLSLPETGALVAEYSLSGSVQRTFGVLRRTGQESDRDVHLGLNSGIPLPAPGGFYFVFRAGVPAFRKFDASGRLVFERHIEGIELDGTVNNLPTRWPRRPSSPGGALMPLVQPVVRSAAVDAGGNLWVSFAVSPHTFMYDPAGEKVRVVRLEAAGTVTPSSLFFSHTGRLLVAPGCYEFEPRPRRQV
jgi:hypothetical protein